MVSKKGVAPLVIVLVLIVVVGAIWYGASSDNGDEEGLGSGGIFFDDPVDSFEDSSPSDPIDGFYDCNNNGQCEINLGEDLDNCPSDCGGGFYETRDECLGDDECPTTSPFCKKHVSADYPEGYMACASCRDTSTDIDHNCKPDNPACVDVDGKMLCQECNADSDCSNPSKSKCTRDKEEFSSIAYSCVECTLNGHCTDGTCDNFGGCVPN